MPDLVHLLLNRAVPSTPYDPAALDSAAQERPLPPSPVRDAFEGGMNFLKGLVYPDMENNKAPLGEKLGALAGFATPLVASGGPSAIPALKEKGANLVKTLLERGTMPKFTFGTNAMDEALKYPKQWKGVGSAVDIPERLAKAMTFAQQRWPRVFGHIAEIGDVDAAAKMANPYILGLSYPQQNPKFSMLQVNPVIHDAMIKDPARTFGHELLHSTDNIAQPGEATTLYKQVMQDPWGYEGSSAELRANLFGERFKQIVDAIQKHLEETGQVTAKIHVPNTDKGTTLRALDLK